MLKYTHSQLMIVSIFYEVHIMNTKQVVDLLLNRETEITAKFHNAILGLMRLDYNTPRGAETISDLIESVRYSLEEIERITGR